MDSPKKTSSELAIELMTSWVNGNREHVVDKLTELNGLQGAAVAARMVLLLHNGHDVPTDLVLFTNRLDSEVCGELL